jgi:hypothetical protein
MKRTSGGHRNQYSGPEGVPAVRQRRDSHGVTEGWLRKQVPLQTRGLDQTGRGEV